MGSRHRSSRVYLGLILLGLISSNLSGLEMIQWEAVDGAQYYKIQLRQNGEIIQEAVTQTNSFSHVLPPGDYEYQITVMNVFDDIVSTTDWYPLRIRLLAKPIIIDCTPRQVFLKEKVEFALNVLGYQSDKTENTAFHLENSSGEIINLRVLDAQQNDEDSISYTVILAVQGQLKIGSWAMIMTQPDKREDRMENAVTVRNKVELQIESISPSVVRVGSPYNHISLTIQGMENEAEIIFNGPSEITATLIQKNDKGLLDYNLNMENAASGWYSVEVRNPSGATQIIKRAIKAEQPIIDIKGNVKQDAEYAHSLAGGYSMNFPIAHTTDFFGPGFYGFSVGYAQEIDNRILRQLPILQDFIFEFYAMVNNAHSIQFDSGDINIWQISLIPGLNYTTSFDFPLNVLLRIGLGLSYSLYSLSGSSVNSDNESYDLSERNSLDLVFRFAAGIQTDISKRVFVNLSLNSVNYFYFTKFASFLLPHIEVGFRW